MNLQQVRRQAVPLHVEVAMMLRNQILSGAIPPGAQLPPLSELVEKFGVARMTIRQAMDSLAAEGLIERHPGRGTFARQAERPRTYTLNMKADLSELQALTSQLHVSVLSGPDWPTTTDRNGVTFRAARRVHELDGRPFSLVNILLKEDVFQRAPDRFSTEIVVSVLQDLQINVKSGRQRVAISYADFEIAQALEIDMNSPVFSVFREFYDTDQNLIYSANLVYPGERLEFNIEFTTGT